MGLQRGMGELQALIFLVEPAANVLDLIQASWLDFTKFTISLR